MTDDKVVRLIGHEGSGLPNEQGITYGALAIIDDNNQVYNAVFGFNSATSFERWKEVVEAGHAVELIERGWVYVTAESKLSYILRISKRHEASPLVAEYLKRRFPLYHNEKEIAFGFADHDELKEWVKPLATILRDTGESRAARVLDPWDGMTQKEWIEQCVKTRVK